MNPWYMYVFKRSDITTPGTCTCKWQTKYLYIIYNVCTMCIQLILFIKLLIKLNIVFYNIIILVQIISKYFVGVTEKVQFFVLIKSLA